MDVEFILAIAFLSACSVNMLAWLTTGRLNPFTPPSQSWRHLWYAPTVALGPIAVAGLLGLVTTQFSLRSVFALQLAQQVALILVRLCTRAGPTASVPHPES